MYSLILCDVFEHRCVCEKSLCEFPLCDEMKINNMDAYRILKEKGAFPAAWESPVGFLSLAPSMQGKSDECVVPEREDTRCAGEWTVCLTVTFR